jgi:diguanylate cyclase (GGDEF)-like protein
MSVHSGINATAAIGRTLGELFPDAARSRLVDAVDYAIDQRMPALLSPALNGTLLCLYQTPEDRRAENRMRHLIHVIPLVGQPAAGACLLQIGDMTAAVNRERVLRQQTENLRRATQQDALTGLANRRYFETLLAREFAKAQREGTSLTLMRVDIDQFSEYKALYGTSRAESCLADVAAALRHGLPSEDLIGRYAEDEFAILLAGADEKQACELAENLRLRVGMLALPHEGAKGLGIVTVSVGIAMIRPTAGSDFDALVSAVDVALFQAKQDGRNRALMFSMSEGNFRSCADFQNGPD